MSGTEEMKRDTPSCSNNSEHNMGIINNNLVVYKTFDQVWKALTCGAVKNAPEVKRIVDLCQQMGLVSRSSAAAEEFKYNVPTRTRSNNNAPFVVIEGLDGTGKTTLVKYVAPKLGMQKMCTPQKKDVEFGTFRDFFDSQEEPIRRAYYSLGNYVAASDVLKCNKPVIMDRYWHSTVAYALAHKMRRGEPTNESDLIWPDDLLKPDLVIFLSISEHERRRRHANRGTNTPEEQILADDEEFRKNLLHLYSSVRGPRFLDISVDGRYQDTKAKVMEAITNALPDIANSQNNQSYLG